MLQRMSMLKALYWFSNSCHIASEVGSSGKSQNIMLHPYLPIPVSVFVVLANCQRQIL